MSATMLSPASRTAALYERVKSVIPRLEWPVFADDIDAILDLKRQRDAVILAHNYQTPEIFHCVADIVGDSLALAREAMGVDAKVIVLAGVHFMAETAKLMNPEKTVLIPDLRAGCSLAASITAADVRLMRARYPDAPVVAYVNTSAEVKAASDICCTSANAKRVVESLGAKRVIMLPDEYLAQNTARQTKVEDHCVGRPLRGARALHRRRGAHAAGRAPGHRRAGASRVPARGDRRGRLHRIHRRYVRLCRAAAAAAGCAADRMFHER